MSPIIFEQSENPSELSKPAETERSRVLRLKLNLYSCLAALLLLGCTLGRCEDQLFACYNQGYLTLEDEDRSVYVSSGGNTYLGRADENGDFIVLGRKPNTSAFGQIFDNGNVMILYSNPDE